MSISGIDLKKRKKQLRKTILVYLVLAATAIVVNFIYGFFGHDVHSAAMTWMFLYPLLGGTIFYTLVNILVPHIVCLKTYRLFYNSYNSGIAALTFGSFLKGILEIAGASSQYVMYFYIAGSLLAAFGFLILLKTWAARQRKAHA